MVHVVTQVMHNDHEAVHLLAAIYVTIQQSSPHDHSGKRLACFWQGAWTPGIADQIPHYSTVWRPHSAVQMLP